MNELTDLIAGVGFPIAVSIYLLVIGRTCLNSLKKSVDRNTVALNALIKSMSGHLER